MRRFFISEIDEDAAACAMQWGTGLEITQFCDPAAMEDDARIARVREQLAAYPCGALHAPYYEIAPCAIDPMIRSVAMHRMRQAAGTCRKLGIKRMVAHSGYAPQVYYPEWFVPKSVEFWKEFVRELPGGFELALENVLDVGPEAIAAVCDGVNDPRLRICLDIGHANVYSGVPVSEWIRCLGRRIIHVHLHNNRGDYDSHNPLDAGSMDMLSVLAELDRHAPDADFSIESTDARSCMLFLKEKGYIHDESLQA